MTFEGRSEGDAAQAAVADAAARTVLPDSPLVDPSGGVVAQQPPSPAPRDVDPLLADSVDEAVAGDPLEDVPEAQPDRRLGTTQDFASIYVRGRSGLESRARRFLSDQRDVDEVVQETFLRLFLAMPEIETEGQALAFCRRVLTNLCIDRYRADRRRPRLFELDPMLIGELGGDDFADHPVLRAEDAAVVRRALSLLTPQYREALVKREIEEKSLPQIAAEMGMPEDSVKHVLFRARRALRRLLVGSAVDPAVDLSVSQIAGLTNRRAARGLVNSGQFVIIALVFVVVAVVLVRVPVGPAGESGSMQPAHAAGPAHAPMRHGAGSAHIRLSRAAAAASHPIPSPAKHVARNPAAPATTSSSLPPPASTPPSDATPTGQTPSDTTGSPATAPVGHHGGNPQGGTPPPGGAPQPGTSPNYVVGGSVQPTGPVAIKKQARVTHGSDPATSVSQLSAPVDDQTFAMQQVLTAPGATGAQMQLVPTVRSGNETPQTLPVASTATSVALDSNTSNYMVNVQAVLAVGNTATTSAAVDEQITYDASMTHILAETVVVSNLDLNAPLVLTSPPTAAAVPGASSGPSATSAAPSDMTEPLTTGNPSGENLDSKGDQSTTSSSLQSDHPRSPGASWLAAWGREVSGG